MDELEVQEGVVIPGWELWFTTSRASGPGASTSTRPARASPCTGR
ncbi:MAG: hypothetical protein R3F43_03565 [bacterium]